MSDRRASRSSRDEPSLKRGKFSSKSRDFEEDFKTQMATGVSGVNGLSTISPLKITDWQWDMGCEVDYRIGNEIGEPSKYGKVYQACCNEPDTEMKECRHVSKVMQRRRSNWRTEIALQKAAAEAGLAPRILRTFLDEAKNEIVIVMERMPGGSMSQYMKTQYNSIDQNQLADQVADLLRRLHALGIVHGDVHPYNIMRDKDGEWKLIDFGWAEQFDRDSEIFSDAKRIKRDYEMLTKLRAPVTYFGYDFEPFARRLEELRDEELLQYRPQSSFSNRQTTRLTRKTRKTRKTRTTRKTRKTRKTPQKSKGKKPIRKTKAKKPIRKSEKTRQRV